MSGDDGEEALQPLAASLDDFIREAVCEDLARQGRDIDAGGLAFENVAERLEIRVSPAYYRVA